MKKKLYVILTAIIMSFATMNYYMAKDVIEIILKKTSSVKNNLIELKFNFQLRLYIQF